MHDLRFRAWDGHAMQYIDDLYWFAENGVHDGTGTRHDAPCVLMQYTGLQDQHGVDIYEGDICLGGMVHLTGGVTLSNAEVATTVTFREGMFQLGRVSLVTFASRITVIGNIYEPSDRLREAR